MNTSTEPRLTSFQYHLIREAARKRKQLCPMGKVVEGRDKRDKILQSGGH
jgi:hypothetical protein